MTNDDFLAALSAPKFKKVESVETPIPMFIRAMGTGEYDEYETLSVGKDGKKSDWSNHRSKYLFYALADEKGGRRFTNLADIARIAAIPDSILAPVWQEAREFNGHDKKAAEAKKKDSGSAGEIGSSSPSA